MTGAGDTVAATLSGALAAEIIVGRLGTSAVRLDDLVRRQGRACAAMEAPLA